MEGAVTRRADWCISDAGGEARDRPNQVWSTDITYIRLPRGFVYLVAMIDWYSRKVLSWRLSNTLECGFCVDCLEQALQAYGPRPAPGTPEIFNTDQGCQFTSEAFTGVLKARGITISMDGRGPSGTVARLSAYPQDLKCVFKSTWRVMSGTNIAPYFLLG